MQVEDFSNFELGSIVVLRHSKAKCLIGAILIGMLSNNSKKGIYFNKNQGGMKKVVI